MAFPIRCSRSVDRPLHGSPLGWTVRQQQQHQGTDPRSHFRLLSRQKQQQSWRRSSSTNPSFPDDPFRSSEDTNLPLPSSTTSSASSLPSSSQSTSISSDLLPLTTRDSTISADQYLLYRELSKRQSDLQRGIGKRYIVRTRLGFLNIHQEPTDPMDTFNVVGQLYEGQIVMSVMPNRGFWICHDAGGWSIAKYGGFVWLEEWKE